MIDEGLSQIQGGRKISKANIFKGKYKPKLEFPKWREEGWGFNLKIHGYFFWDNTIYHTVPEETSQHHLQ